MKKSWINQKKRKGIFGVKLIYFMAYSFMRSVSIGTWDDSILETLQDRINLNFKKYFLTIYLCYACWNPKSMSCLLRAPVIITLPLLNTSSTTEGCNKIEKLKYFLWNLNHSVHQSREQLRLICGELIMRQLQSYKKKSQESQW